MVLTDWMRRHHPACRRATSPYIRTTSREESKTHYDEVVDLVAEQVAKTFGRISAKRLLPAGVPVLLRADSAARSTLYRKIRQYGISG